jgi:hypothetical protein
VISVGALTPILCFHKLEITPPSNFNHTCYGTNFETIMFHQMEQIIKQFEKHVIKAKRQLTSTKDSAN